ncbi:MAG: hypothetical protein HOO06_09945 [Bdellovibrionaceae bacterium]|nr:hypothetical protein [Pseudobdellovibrionaceae bacterium]
MKILIKLILIMPFFAYANSENKNSSQKSTLAVKDQSALLNNKSSTMFSLENSFISKVSTFDEGEDSAYQVIFGYQPSLKFNIHSKFNIDTQFSINLGASRVQSRFQRHSDNDTVLNELSMNYLPIENLKFSLGAINQKHLESPHLVSGVTFPGFKLEAKTKGKGFNIGAKTQYLVPTSSSFDSDRSESEVLPNFQTQGIFASYNGFSKVDLQAQWNLYSFSNLPSVVAYESKRLGNFYITGTDVSESAFAVDYAGLSQSYNAKINYTKGLSHNLFASIVENQNLESGSNRAQSVGTSLDVKIAQVVLTPSITTFFSETDASPAFYNSSDLGHSNRQGMKYSLRTYFKKLKFAIQANLIDSQVLNISAYQQDLVIAELFVEMINVRF